MSHARTPHLIIPKPPNHHYMPTPTAYTHKYYNLFETSRKVHCFYILPKNGILSVSSTYVYWFFGELGWVLRVWMRRNQNVFVVCWSWWNGKASAAHHQSNRCRAHILKVVKKIFPSYVKAAASVHVLLYSRMNLSDDKCVLFEICICKCKILRSCEHFKIIQTKCYFMEYINP